jgi:hypothetical protein
MQIGWIDQLPGSDGRVDLLLTGHYGSRSASVAFYFYNTTMEVDAPGQVRSFTLTYWLTIFVIHMQHHYRGIKLVRRDLCAKIRDVREREGHTESVGEYWLVTEDRELATRLTAPPFMSSLLVRNIRWLDLRDHDLIMAWKGPSGSPRVKAGLDAISAVADMIEHNDGS